MKRFLQPNVDFVALDQARLAQQRAQAPRAQTAGAEIFVQVHLFPPLAPAPAPAPPPEPKNSIDEAEDDAAMPTPRPRSYSSTELSPGDRQLVLDLLFRKKNSDGSFAMDCVEVATHLAYYHPRLKVPLRTLQRWRSDGPGDGDEYEKRGTKAVLSKAHRDSISILLKELTEDGGSPMNWQLARPIILGYFQENNLEHLYSEKPKQGFLSLSQSWINDLFLEYRLVPRKQTTDAQSVPQVPLVYVFFLSFLFVCSL